MNHIHLHLMRLHHQILLLRIDEIDQNWQTILHYYKSELLDVQDVLQHYLNFVKKYELQNYFYKILQHPH